MKLVRDQIPGMHERGELGPHPQGSAHRDAQAFRKATPEEFRLLLRVKLAEECGEVLGAVRREHLAEELTDVYEVLCSLIVMEGFSPGEIERRARQKAVVYGGFGEGWVLEEKE